MSTNETENICGLKRADFQTTINGKQTDLYVLRNDKGHEVAITNYGGALVAIMVPDKEGKLANVIQGHDNIQDVINSPEQYLSTLVVMAIVFAKVNSNFTVKSTTFQSIMVQTLFMVERKALMLRFGTLFR